MGRIYFDYAASTPVDPLVLKEMLPYFGKKYGNPGSLHRFGQETIAAVDTSRETIAQCIGADFREIIFTGSATEANNLALRGIMKAFSVQRSVKLKIPYTPHPQIIVSAVEHESILETAKDLEKEGIEIVIVPVDKNGIIDLGKLKSSLNERTVLVSIMYVNNVIGTVQPIVEIAKIIRDCKIARLQDCKIKKKSNNFAISNQQSAIYPLFHTDAAQAFQYLDCDVQKLGVDLMTLSAQKIYGPKGIGALYAGYRVQGTGYSIQKLNPQPPTLNPIVTGGGQEFGLRSGTENVPAIVGFAKAAELAVKNRKKVFKHVSELRNYFWKELKKIYQQTVINGIDVRTIQILEHVPHILNIYFPNQKSQDLLIKLDMAGIAVSSGAACSARSSKLSHVLKAIDLPIARIQGSVRFSFGKYTTKAELLETLKRIEKILLH